jgi:hypothetical protein
MRNQIEIVLYQYKKQNNLDVYSPMDFMQRWVLLLKIWDCINRVEFKVSLKHGKTTTK